MPYSITTKDGITIRNIPDNVAADSQVLKDRVAKIRADSDGTSDQIPGTPNSSGNATAQQAAPAEPEPTVMDHIKAAVTDTPRALVNGLIGGTVGAVGGTIGGLAGSIMSGEYGTPQGANNVEQAASDSAIGLTNGLNSIGGDLSEASKRQLSVIGKGMEQLVPGMGLTSEMGAIGRAAAPIVQAAQDVSAEGAQIAKGAGVAALERMKSEAPAIAARVERIIRRNPDNLPATTAATPGTKGSVGAAATDMADQRKYVADQMGIPLTEGQITRNPDQLRFEVETAKGDKGALLRERAAEQNERFQKKFDDFVDITGAETVEPIEVGRSVDSALRNEMARDKAQVRTDYNMANNSAEAELPVTLSGVVDFLNENAPNEAVSNLLVAAKARALRTGAAVVAGDSGELVAIPTTVKNAELFRRSIGEATDYEPTNIRNSAALKGLIDSETEQVAGPLYRTARRTRENYAKKYEDRAIVSQITRLKRGTADRQVALEDVFKETILNGTREDLSYLRAALAGKGSESGIQAWNDLQGATLDWMKNEMLKNVATDQRGNAIVSAANLNKAMARLEKGRKLDFIFGKRYAEQLRDVNDLAKVLFTAPPGVINTSNTASVILAALTEAGVNGSLFGLPLPVMSGVRMLAKMSADKKLAARIEASLNGPQRRRTSSAQPAPTQLPSP